MGYYVNTEDVDIFLDKKHFDDVYKQMCELNDHDELKRGGRSPRTEEYTTRYNPNVWFSWMDYNYPETCSDMIAILVALGFDYRLDDDGNLVDLFYDNNKMGNEDYFLACFAGYIKPGSYITYKGEDDVYWRYFFTDKAMICQNGSLNISFTDGEVYRFAKLSVADKLIKEQKRNYKIQLEKETKKVSE